MFDYLLIVLAIGVWFKKTRMAALLALATVSLLHAAADTTHFHILSALGFGLCAFLYLDRVRKDLAAKAQGRPYDQAMEERGERAYMQMKDWLSRHSRHWRET